MGSIESISTTCLPPPRRASFWNEAISRAFTQLEARPNSTDAFNASLQRVEVGDYSIARAVSSPCQVRHTEMRSRRVTEQVYLVHLQADGSSLNVQDGHEALLQTGDFTICDSARPYTVRFDTLNDMLVLRIPATHLRARIVQPEDFMARCFVGDRGPGLLVSQLIQHWWKLCLSDLDREVSRRIATNVLDLLVTTMCAGQPCRIAAESITNAHRLRIHQFIEDHLTDPGLGAARIAAAIGVTPRYVYRLLEQSGETLGQRILRCRLELCARRLRDPALTARSITAIAFDCAFSDASYFTRCFRRQYGTTPGEYRHQCD